MNRREFLGALAAVPALAATGPNIVLLLVDDLGWRDFGAYGSLWSETPEVDRLAREGVRFTDAYAAAPVCSPTRASILTGKYPARLQLTDWLPGRKQHAHSKLLVPKIEPHLAQRETTLAEALRSAGYRTANIGKWHLGGPGSLPEDHGFDINVGGDDRGMASHFGPFPMPGLAGRSKNHYLAEELTAAAENFIGESGTAQKPFFLYMPHYAVHIPLEAPAEAVERHRSKPGAKAFPDPRYAALVESVDRSLRRIRQKLRETGLDRNTIIMVTSGNGGLRFEGSRTEPVTDNSPLRAGKGHLYGGGIRVPLIVCWPGRAKAGSVVSAPVCSIDLLPTLLSTAGIALSGPVDGVDVSATFRGGRMPPREALYWHYPHYSNQGGAPSGAVRQGDWKLIEFYEDGRLELYNLRRDLGEKTNLASSEPRRTQELHELLKKWRAAVGATMPMPNPAYDPAKANQGLTGAERS